MKKLIALILAVAMVMSMVCFASADDEGFTDAAKIDQKNTEAVTVLSEMGIIAGMGDGTFAPTNTLTRAQAAKIICYMLLGAEKAEALPADTSAFTDVPAGHWSCKYVNYCAQQGIAAGVGSGKFNPNGKLTGFAFGKMMLCGVLGKNAEAEGLTGSSWEVNTNKMLKNEGLNMGVTVSSTDLSRENACHLALNFLFYGEKEDPMSTLAYKVFHITRASGKSERATLYRPTNVYTTEEEDVCWDGTDLIVNASPFFVSESGTVSGGKLYTACGEREVPLENMAVYRNGTTATMANVVNSIAKGSGEDFEKGRVVEGVALECYYDGTNDFFTFVILSTRAVKVTAVTPANKTSDGQILEHGSVSFEGGGTMISDDFTEADIGKYVCAQGLSDGSSWYNNFKTVTKVWPGTIVTGKLGAGTAKNTIVVGTKSYTTTGHSAIDAQGFMDAGHQVGEEINVLVYGNVALAIWN